MRAAAAAALLVLAAAFPTRAVADPASDLLSVGRKAFADGQYSLAVSSFQRITDEYPDSASVEEASYLRGVSLFYAGRWAESLSAFSLLGIRHPHSAFLGRASYWVGAADLKLGNWQSAYDSLSAFLKDPASAGPYTASATLYRGVALEGLGRDTEAAAVYREVLSRTPSADQVAELTYRLAGIELRAGRYASARDLYGRVLLSFTSSPFVGDAAFYTGECELALGNLPEAERRYLTVISLYPESPNVEPATFRLADIAWRQRRDSALRRVEDYLQRFPTGSRRGSALKLKADILLDRRRTAEAVDSYQLAVGILPDGAEKQTALYQMGTAQLSLGRKQDAADSLGRAGTGGSAAVAEKARFQQAVILTDLGRTADAITVLRSFLADFPDSSRAQEAGRLLGTLQEKQGDRDGARASWNGLIERFPDSPVLAEYLFRRGNDWMAAGRWGMALDDLQRVRRDFAGSPWAGPSTYSIGYIYAHQGEYPRALPFFTEASQAPVPADAARARLSAAICLFDMGRFDQAVTALRTLQPGGAAGAAPDAYVVAGAVSAPAAPPVSSGTVALYIGRSLYRMGRLGDAAASLGGAAAALAAEGSALGADALYWRGWALLRLQKPADAASAFLAMAGGYPSDPRHREALLRAAICRTLQSDDAGALALFQQVIDEPGAGADSIAEQALYEKELALARLGRDAEAETALQDLLQRFPASALAAQSLYSRAEQALSDKRYGDAVAGFDQVRAAFPRGTLAAPSAFWAAEAARRSGAWADALPRYWACLLLPAGALASNLLTEAVDGFSESLRANGDLSVARDFSSRAASTPSLGDEASAGVQLAAAGMLLESSPSEARAVAARVAAAAPPEPYAGEASLLLAECAERASDWNRALDILGALESSRADDVGARAALEKGRALQAMGRTSDAVDEYLKVAYLFPGLADRAAEGMARAVSLARQRGDSERAARIERSLRSTYPDSPWLQGLSAE